MRVKPQSLTRLIANLQRQGLITRQLPDEDRRQSPIEITEAGVRVLAEEVREQRTRFAAVIEKELTPAEQEMLRIAAGLMERVAGQAEAAFSHSGRSKRTAKDKRDEGRAPGF
jgi:DNA-binding MarR family transcriptional regulator